MPLDPEVAAILAALAEQPRVELSDATIAEVRAQYDMMGPLGAGDPPEVASAADHDADGVPVRIFTPHGTGPHPVVVTSPGASPGARAQ